MLTKLFDYYLPESLIAKYPLEHRSDSRMLVYDRNAGNHLHSHTRDLASFFNEGDMLVVNDTKVLRARMYGKKISGGKIEVLLERVLSEHTFLAHIKSSRSPKIDSKILIGNDELKVVSRKGSLFECEANVSVKELMNKYGNVPIPPYFSRDSEEIDNERYQTIYAREDGSVAAPTAGLHIDDIIKSSLNECGVNWGSLTLHVGAGTFQPVKSEDTDDHVMHSESFEISEELANGIFETKAKGKRVIAVGTTTVRALESSYSTQEKKIEPGKRMTNLFLTPGSEFKIVDGVLTNFHLPGSSLLMLVSAFMGLQEMHDLYSVAINERYRFYSYGDAMLIL